MEEPSIPMKDKLMQELESLGPVLVAHLQRVKDSMQDGDLEALHLLAEGKGTLRLKVREWSDPSPLDKPDARTTLLRLLLVFLWQINKLNQMSYDPLDLRLRPKQMSKAPGVESIGEEAKAAEPLTTGADALSVLVNPEDMQEEDKKTTTLTAKRGDSTTLEDENNKTKHAEDDEIALTEDGTNYLLGPLEVDLRRIDHYHPLFCTYRKSAGLRQEQFLNSNHIKHVRKLSGISRYDFGYEFNRSVLEKVASSVEDLDLGDRIDSGDLKLLQDLSMPKLRRLNIWLGCVGEDPESPPFLFPPPRENHHGLRWLRAHLPRPALESLIQANSKTLLELHLQVGTPRQRQVVWPYSCLDLDTLLQDCRGTLRILHIVRGGLNHDRDSCKEQIEAVRRSQPELVVTCDKCCSE